MWKQFEALNRLEKHFRRVSSALYGEAKKSQPRTWSGRIHMSFHWGWWTSHQKSPSVLTYCTQLYYSAFHNFWNLEPFINAGSGLVLKYVKSIRLKYIAFEGKRCVLKWFCFLANVVSIFFTVCLLRHQWKANNWFPVFFAVFNLQAVKRNCFGW